jgi:hypothetical protein
MTENEAKTKWCPYSRVLITLDIGNGLSSAIGNANRQQDKPLGMCLGSECMAWRWNRDVSALGALNTRPGFCGLAGVPGA